MRCCAETAAIASALIVGNVAALSGVKYVITLDTDTQLPRDSARQFVGVMAHPLNRARFGASGKRGESCARDRRLRDPAAARRREPARREPLAVRAPARRRHRPRPLHARGLRRLSGRVRRRLLHRQGDLRRRRVRARADRPLPRQPDPEPRPDRGLLRALGTVERRPALRGISVDLRRRHEPPASLDSRRLATRGWLLSRVPGPGRAGFRIRCRCSRSGSSSTTCGEVSSRRRSRCCCCSRGRCFRITSLWTLVVIVVVLLPWVCAVVLEAWSKPDEALPKQHLAATTAVAGRNAAQTLLTLAFLPYEAIVNLDAIARTCWRMLVTHRRLLEWNPSAMEDPERRSAGSVPRRTGLFASVRSMWFVPAIARHGCDPARRIGLPRTGRRHSDPRPVVHCTGSRLVGKPATSATRGESHHRADRISPQARAPHMGFLRGVRGTGRPVAAARQRAGASRGGGRASHVTDQHGAVAARQPDGLRLRLHPGWPARRAHCECARHDVRAGAPRGALLQLVRHADRKAVAAALCLVGGQRQSRRASHDAAVRARRRCRRQDRRRALVRRPEPTRRKCSPRPSAEAFRHRFRTSCAISRPPTTRGRRRSRRHGNGSTGSAPT